MASVQPVEVKIFGTDRKKLEEFSQQVAEIVTHVEGTADVFDGIIMTGPYIHLEPDAEKLARFGLTPANVQFQVQTLLEGNIVGSINEKEQFTNVRMIYPASQ
jgi:Cu/Ag efflux pump CusA